MERGPPSPQPSPSSGRGGRGFLFCGYGGNKAGVNVVSLLTDFGQKDTYVAQVKGALLTIAPEAQLVDLTHDIPPQNVRLGAFHLMAAVAAFPAGTIHLAVVDPGVGTARRAIAIQTSRGDHLVGPDNGLLSLAVEKLGGLVSAAELNKERYWRPSPSRTFHGRDIFAPVVGHLIRGVALHDLGSPLMDLAPGFALPKITLDEGKGVGGEVIHIDSFGNLITNVSDTQLPRRFSIQVRGQTIQGGPAAHYQAVPPGQLVALIGSMGLLEIAVRDGSAADFLGTHEGDSVRILLSAK